MLSAEYRCRSRWQDVQGSPPPSRAAEPCRAHFSHGTHMPPMASRHFGHACAGLSPLAKGIERRGG